MIIYCVSLRLKIVSIKSDDQFLNSVKSYEFDF